MALQWIHIFEVGLQTGGSRLDGKTPSSTPCGNNTKRSKEDTFTLDTPSLQEPDWNINNFTPQVFGYAFAKSVYPRATGYSAVEEIEHPTTPVSKKFCAYIYAYLQVNGENIGKLASLDSSLVLPVIFE